MDPEDEKTASAVGDAVEGADNDHGTRKEDRCVLDIFKRYFRRDEFAGATVFNILSLLLPALYSTLSKLWVAKIDPSMVATSAAYGYIDIIVGIVNDGLPHAAFIIIGDGSSRTYPSRLRLAHTLIFFQTAVGLILSIAVAAAADKFATSFVPERVRSASLTYVRISAFSGLTTSLENAVSSSTRALDKPDVPLIINLVKVFTNIVLDLLLISTFHIGSFTPTVNMQAAIRLSCALAAAFVGWAYFMWFTNFRIRDDDIKMSDIKPSFKAWLVLARPGFLMFVESAIRNSIYLWLVTGVVALGSDYATAWDIFITIRWGLVMVPVLSLQLSSLTFVSHGWGEWRFLKGVDTLRPKATREELLGEFPTFDSSKVPRGNLSPNIGVIRPALLSICLGLLVEIPLCIFLSIWGCEAYARWLSNSDAVGAITAHMWRTIDWCYIFFAMSAQLGTVLQATRPSWFLYWSLTCTLLYMLPWAIVCQVKTLDAENAWTYHSLVFGGGFVFGFVDVLLFDLAWYFALIKGIMTLEPFHKAE